MMRVLVIILIFGSLLCQLGWTEAVDHTSMQNIVGQTQDSKAAINKQHDDQNKSKEKRDEKIGGIDASSLSNTFSNSNLVPNRLCDCGNDASYAPLVDQLMPAVVSITATKKQKDKKINAMNGLSFKDLRDLMDSLQSQMDNRNSEKSMFLFGSGFVIDPSGIIVTNNHVVENADEIIVKFNDDSTLQAKVLGRDSLTDIAVLKVDSPRPLHYVKFGDSDEARIGDRVLVIGSPVGLGGSVSAGIVSARSRDIHAGPYDDFIQTDAPLNQGSSGSPLFNMKGQVVGINTAIYSTSGGGNIGIGFAIPSNSAVKIVDILKTKSKVRRGYLGVTVQEITNDISEALGKDRRGVIVNSVVKDSPAEKGGLQVGDIIMEFNGTPILKVREFSKSVAYYSIGKKASLKVIRQDEEMVLQISVGELDLDKQQKVGDKKDNDDEEDKGDSLNILGIKVRTINPDVRREYGLSDKVVGVVVISVDSGSEAELRGIRRYDIVNQVTFAGKRIDIVNIEDLKKAIKSAEEQKVKSVLLQVIRSGHAMFVPLPLGAKSKKT